MVESEEGAEEAFKTRIHVALFAAEDGRFDDALDALARAAAERPSDPRPQLRAAGICYLAGLMEEGNLWLFGIPGEIRRENLTHLYEGVLAATLGAALGAFTAFQGLVGLAAFEVMDAVLWAKVLDGDISILKKMLLVALLWRGVVAGKYKDYCQGRITVTKEGS